MHTIETHVYTLAELPAAAKEKARDWYRAGGMDYDWWEFTYETAKTAGACLGIEVEAIYFTDFYSQGAGASIRGTYSYARAWRDRLAHEFGGETLAELCAIGQALQDAQRPAFYKIGARMACNNRGNWTDIDVLDDDAPRGAIYDAQDIARALRAFVGWMYEMLRSEHEYLTSDAAVDESIEANEYTFTVDGRRFG